MFLPFLSGSSEIEYKGFVTYYVSEDGYLEPCLHPGDCEQTYPSLSLMDTRLMLRMVVPKITEALQKQIPAELQKKERHELVKNLVKRAPTQIDLEDIFATPSPTKERARSASGGDRASIHKDIAAEGTTSRSSSDPDRNKHRDRKQPEHQHVSKRDAKISHQDSPRVCGPGISESATASCSKIQMPKQSFSGAIVDDYMSSPPSSTRGSSSATPISVQGPALHQYEEMFTFDQDDHDQQTNGFGAPGTYSRNPSPVSSEGSSFGDEPSLDDGHDAHMKSPFSMHDDGLRNPSAMFSHAWGTIPVAPDIEQMVRDSARDYDLDEHADGCSVSQVDGSKIGHDRDEGQSNGDHDATEGTPALLSPTTAMHNGGLSSSMEDIDSFGSRPRKRSDGSSQSTDSPIGDSSQHVGENQNNLFKFVTSN